MTRHLAVMCRQYNDYGSLVRDAEEGNLNSIDFAEFCGFANPNTEEHDRSYQIKKQDIRQSQENLMALADME
jgi:hypothetical protein